jgi:glycosyltransferase involved in cell wall biosynthesis
MSQSAKYYLIAAPFFPSERQPHYCNFIYDQAVAIKQLSGLEVIVFLRGSQQQAGTEYRGIRVEYFDFKETPSYLFNGYYNRHNARSFTKKVAQLGIDPQEIYAIHGHISTFGVCGLNLKRINPKIKTIVQHHDPDPFTLRNGRFASNWINLYYRAIKNRRLFSKIDCHISISQFTERNLLNFPNNYAEQSFDSYRRRVKLAKHLGIKPASIKHSVIVHNGVDTNKFYADKRSGNDIIKIGIIANYIDWKRHDILALAIKKLVDKGFDNIQLLTVGTNPIDGFHAFQQLVDNLGLTRHVEYLPAIAHDQLRSFYNSIDLFVLPSVFEGFGCVYTEAYACGTPFIGCLGQGIEDMIRDDEKSLWLARPNDADDLASKIQYFIVNRPKQTLDCPIDISTIISQYLATLAKI